MVAEQKKYSLPAIVLHWIMAICFILMLSSGLAMGFLELTPAFKYKLYQWHKSLGVLLLLAFFLRLFVRYIFPRPALSSSMKSYEKLAAHAGHFLMYVCMFALPFSGWAMVSASPLGIPTMVFGWFEWPHIPFFVGDEVVGEAAYNAHQILAYSFIGLIGVHVGAVVKHWVFDKENLLPRMGIGRTK